MKIRLSDSGKRFNREWIFRHADLEFDSATSCAITGPNGSGKSTLLQCIGGMLQLSEGGIAFSVNDQPLPPEQAYKKISFCAPYLDLIEEMTLSEFLEFHRQFKPYIDGLDVTAIIGEIGLQRAAGKQIRFFSSGMKQRVKLAQALLSEVEAVLLDEPCVNLDAEGIALYHSLIERYCRHRLVLVCSNDEVEYRFCERVVSVVAFKTGGA